MNANVGKVDRIVRVVIGLALIGWGMSAGNWWGAVGIVPLATALIGWCPIYAIFGFSTCKVEESKVVEEAKPMSDSAEQGM